MSKSVYEYTVELLDRKLRFLMETQNTFFNLELERFVTFLTEDELVRDVANKLKQEVDERKATYQCELKQARERACELKDRLLATHPETADQEGDDYTFAEFDLLVSGEPPITIPKFQEKSLRDDSEVKKLIDILCAKLNTLEDQIRHGKLSITIDGELGNGIDELQREQEFNCKKWFNFNKTSSGRALSDLENEVSEFNPHPKATNYFLIKHFDEGVGDRTYSDTEQHKYHFNEKDNATFALLREKARRVYEGIHQEIGATRLRSQLLDRYATRCKLYQRDFLRRLLTEEKASRSKRENNEHRVTQDLALYLYDQGVTTTYQLPIANRELDLIDLDSKNPMVIEVKAYKSGKDKLRLRDGVHQLYDYLDFLDSHLHLTDGYYVYFRIGGPIIRFEDDPVRLGKFTIYPKLIDLAESKETGSKSKEPIFITRDLIESKFKKKDNERKAEDNSD